MENNEHPALATVIWTCDDRCFKAWVPGSAWDRGRCEHAEYRGCKLRVRHTGDYNIGTGVTLGYIDGKYLCSRPNMPQICDALFRAVDAKLDH